MAIVKRIKRGPRSIGFLTATLMVTTWFAWSGVGQAKPKGPTYNECACRCVAPGDIVGSISHFRNDAGLSCNAYAGKTCNYTNSQTGGVSTGTLKNCGGFKPGGTKALVRPPLGDNPPVLQHRGVEPDSPTVEGEKELSGESGDVKERAVKKPNPKPKPRPQPVPPGTPPGPGTPPTFPK